MMATATMFKPNHKPSDPHTTSEDEEFMKPKKRFTLSDDDSGDDVFVSNNYKSAPLNQIGLNSGNANTASINKNALQTDTSDTEDKQEYESEFESDTADEDADDESDAGSENSHESLQQPAKKIPSVEPTATPPSRSVRFGPSQPAPLPQTTEIADNAFATNYLSGILNVSRYSEKQTKFLQDPHLHRAVPENYGIKVDTNYPPPKTEGLTHLSAFLGDFATSEIESPSIFGVPTFYAKSYNLMNKVNYAAVTSQLESTKAIPSLSLERVLDPMQNGTMSSFPSHKPTRTPTTANQSTTRSASKLPEDHSSFRSKMSINHARVELNDEELKYRLGMLETQIDLVKDADKINPRERIREYLDRQPELTLRSIRMLSSDQNSSSVYYGTMLDNRRQGWGVCRWKNGHEYRGQWMDNDMGGLGVYIWPRVAPTNLDPILTPPGPIMMSNVLAMYKGEFSNGCFSGTGYYTDKDGSTYQGTFENNAIEGQGTLKLANRIEYRGSFVQNKAGGRGTVSFPDRSTYDGTFREGVQHGEGTYIWEDGDVEYKGSFSNGHMEGRGVATWRKKYGHIRCINKYDGYWVNSLRDGYGTYFWNDATVYKGAWEDGVRKKTHGIISYPDGTKKEF